MDVTQDKWDPMVEEFNSVIENYQYQWKKDRAACVNRTVTLFVRNIPPEINNNGLLNIFSHAGKVVRAHIASNKDIKHKNNIGFVDYSSAVDASKAISMFHNKYIFSNLKLEVFLSKPLKRNTPPPPAPKTLPAKSLITPEVSPEVLSPGMGRGKCLQKLLACAQGSKIGSHSTETCIQTSSELSAVAEMDNHSTETCTQISSEASSITELDSHSTETCVQTLSKVSAITEMDNHSTETCIQTLSEASAIREKTENEDNMDLNKSFDSDYCLDEDYMTNHNTVFMPFEPCSVCQILAKFICSDCRNKWYCSQNCQIKDWNKHKKECSRKKIDGKFNKQFQKISQKKVPHSQKHEMEATLNKTVELLPPANLDFSNPVQIIELDDDDPMLLLPETLPEDDEFEVELTWTVRPNQFWIRLWKNTNLLNSLHDKMTQFYSQVNKYDDPLIVQPGLICAAYCRTENLWHRCRILGQCFGMVIVIFIDIGKLEVISVSDIRRLNAEMMQLPIQAFEVSIANISSVKSVNNMDYCQFLQENFLKKKSLCQKISQDKTALKVELVYESSALLSNVLIEKGYAFPLMVSCADNETSISFVSEVPVVDQIHSGQDITITFASIINPSVFCVWLISDQTFVTVNKLHELQSIYNEATSNENFRPKIGEMVAAKYLLENYWCRAVVKSTQKSRCTIYFVDLDYCQSCKYEDIHPLKSDFYNFPYLAIPAKLDGIESFVDGLWSEDVVSFFKTTIYSKIFHAYVVNINKRRISLEIKDVSGISLNELLVEEGFAKKVEMFSSDLDSKFLSPSVHIIDMPIEVKFPSVPEISCLQLNNSDEINLIDLSVEEEGVSQVDIVLTHLEDNPLSNFDQINLIDLWKEDNCDKEAKTSEDSFTSDDFFKLSDDILLHETISEEILNYNMLLYTSSEVFLNSGDERELSEVSPEKVLDSVNNPVELSLLDSVKLSPFEIEEENVLPQVITLQK